MQVKLELLTEGDSVLNVWDNKIAVNKTNGEVEIFTFEYDEDNLPRLSKDTVMITYGKGAISMKKDGGSLKVDTF